MHTVTGISIQTTHCSPFSVKDILGLHDDDDLSSNGDDKESIRSNDEIREDPGVKKTRQCFTVKQVEELEKLFNEINYPDAYTRQMLAKRMNVSETRIQIWCQNRRAKIRRQRKQRKRIITPLHPASHTHPTALCCPNNWTPALHTHHHMPVSYYAPTTYKSYLFKPYEQTTDLKATSHHLWSKVDTLRHHIHHAPKKYT